MTVIDQSAYVPRLDRAALGRLSSALDRDGVAAAYLFGSCARGSAGPLSDIDIALLHDDSILPAEVHDLRLDLIYAAGAALKTTEIDLVIVNRASPLLRHNVITDGELLLERDPRARVEFQAAALRDYLDTAPLRAEFGRGLRRRIQEDRYGRP